MNYFKYLFILSVAMMSMYSFADIPNRINSVGELAKWIESLSESEITRFNNENINPRLSPSIGTESGGMRIEQGMAAGRVVSFVYTAPDFYPTEENILLSKQRLTASFCEVPIWLGLMGGGYSMLFDYRDSNTFERKYRLKLDIHMCEEYLKRKIN